MGFRKLISRQAASFMSKIDRNKGLIKTKSILFISVYLLNKEE